MIKIYKLIHNGKIVYVGQTKLKYLSSRKKVGYGDTVPFYKECKIELIEETDDVSRERYWIDLLRSEGHPLLNKRGGSTGLDKEEGKREWHKNNKEYKKTEKYKEYHKEYNEKNKEKISEKKKEYYEKNKEKKREYYLKRKLLKDISQ